MVESIRSDETIREYLLGRVSDETRLEGIEELLFTDEDFCSQVALVEDGIINDYVFGRLNEVDAESFRRTLAGNPDRSFKLELTQALREKALAAKLKPGLIESTEKPGFFAALKAFFRQPIYVGAFAVLLIAGLISVVYFSSRSNPDNLAELRSIYQQARPTQSRISEFGYAPLSQLRGAPEPADQKRLRRIEVSLIEATEKNPNAQTHHALGVFDLTQQKYADAIKEFQSALKFADQSAQIHNELGSVYFELARTEAGDKQIEHLAQSLEEFTRATKLDPNLLEALFNLALARQELKMPREARESWTLYLQKDPSSRWADEARKNLARIETDQALKRSDREVLEDFLTAYRNHDEPRAQRIHDETKGQLKPFGVALQLSRRYLVAKQRGNEAEAQESLDALSAIGRFEQTRDAEFFFSEFADFYARVTADKIDRLIEAKDRLASGDHLYREDLGKAIAEFEKSRDHFVEVGDICEAAIAETWAAQLLPDVARIAEGRRRLAAVITDAENRKFKLLLPPAYYWLGFSDYHQNRLSDSNKQFKIALRLAEAGNNIFEAHHNAEALALNYSELSELGAALSYASKMLSFKASYYEDKSQSLRDLGTLADLTLKLKFFSTSLSLSRESLSLAQESLNVAQASAADRAKASEQQNSDINDALRHLVNASVEKKDFNAALNYANESKRVALGRGKSAENTRLLAEINMVLGDVRTRMNDCSQAVGDYEQALELYAQLPEFAFNLYPIHKGKLFCFQQLYQQENFDRELKTVLRLSEEYRATIREDDSRQAFFANEQDVFDAAAVNAIKAGDSRGAYGFVEESRARSLLDFVESNKPIAAVEKDFGAVVQPLKLEEIQARLPEQVQLVQYAVLRDRLAIWVLSKKRFDLVEKSISAAELEKKIADYQAAIVSQAPASDLQRAGKELYELLIPAGLAGDKQLCLVPDKSLHQLAFASLVSPGGKYLLEDFALSYAPSGSVFVLASENARRKERVEQESVLSVGNPDFERDENQNLADLPTAAAEAKAIAADYRNPLELFGAEATKEKFLQSFAGVDVIHFAGHFVANPRSPGNSKLLFAGGELRSSQLGTYKLPRAKLVVLSACETGFERYDKSEGAIGIARTFLALGAPLVVASEWKVDSEPTKDLMIAFHRNRREKKLTTAESLRQAQLETMSRKETRSPFYWAAFSLFGGYAKY